MQSPPFTLMPKSFKYFFSLFNLHSVPHDDEVKTGFEKRLQIIMKEKLKLRNVKNHIDISIQTLYSVLS